MINRLFIFIAISLTIFVVCKAEDENKASEMMNAEFVNVGYESDVNAQIVKRGAPQEVNGGEEIIELAPGQENDSSKPVIRAKRWGQYGYGGGYGGGYGPGGYGGGNTVIIKKTIIRPGYGGYPYGGGGYGYGYGK